MRRAGPLAPHLVRRFAAVAGLLTITSQCAAGAAGSQASLAIRGIDVIDVRLGTLRSNRTVLVAGDRILQVGHADSLQIPDGADVIDGEGMFALPGLADMHVHIEADDLPLMLANGITTVRDMNGSEETLALREAVRGGAVDGPQMFVAGPLLAGTEQRVAHRLISTAEEARAEVRLEAALGYDFVKVYDGLTPENYQAIVAAAGAAGIPVVGHIPEAVGLDWVLGHGQTSVEHVEQLVQATVGHDLDTDRIPGIAEAIASSGVSVTPTLAAVEILSDQRSTWFAGLFGRDEMAYAPLSVRSWWESLKPRSRGASRAGEDGSDEEIPGGTSAWVEFHRALTRALAEAGIPILVGTDTPNPLLVPGFSIHQELAALHRAGLDPRALLRAATLGAAEFLGQADDVGAIEEGMRADIVLVGGDPLGDLAALRDVRGLIVRGKWMSGEHLAGELAAVRARRAR